MMPDNYNNHDRLSEAEAYFKSLANPDNLNSGEIGLLPKGLQDKWHDLASMEEEYYCEYRYLHPDERKDYENAIRVARKDFKNDIELLYHEYADSKNQFVSEPEMSISNKKSEDMKTTETPLMKQYEEMKKKHPDAILLFRVGDFYETFKQDAIAASEILGITLTRRANGKSSYTELAGFPHHALDTYLPKLVRAGKRVAICEQLEDPRLKKTSEHKVVEKVTPNQSKKEDSTISNNSSTAKDMAKKKSSEESVKSSKKSKTKENSETKTTAKRQSKKTTSKDEPKVTATGNDAPAVEDKAIRTARPPQMVTVNGQNVTHGHAYQGNVNPQNWYFTAKLDGVQLKPQLMSQEDLAAYARKELTVPQLMEKYYPTKLMEKVPEVAFKFPNVIAGPDSPLTVDKFNVYKEKDPARDDFGKYKFYAQVGDKKMSVLASKEDLNAYFDHVKTPGQLVEKNFGERLHLASAYEKYKLPEGVDPDKVRIGKSKDGSWTVSVDLGERGKTSRAPLSYDDGFSYFQAKTATREQLAAKYLGSEINSKMSESLTANVSKSHKM